MTNIHIIQNSMQTWNPSSYLKYEDYRTRPAIDLVSRIRVEVPQWVIDLGCGPGNSTQVLWSRWPNACVVGLDSSPEMIAAAQDIYPDQHWRLGDIATWVDDLKFDVVFSNAALQWLGNHGELLPRLFRQVAPGGALALQIPATNDASIRSIIHEVSEDSAWSYRMNGARAALTFMHPSEYYDMLATNAQSVDLWETEYQHVLKSPAAIIEWISSTGLRPFLDALQSDDERQRFMTMLLDRVTEAYPLRADGNVLFPFRRLFIVAYA